VPPGYQQFGQAGSQSGGTSMSNGSGGPGGAGESVPTASAAQITAAAKGLESLSPAARHDWLAANIGGVRSGAVSLARVP
jgi:hypothetical protein